MKKIFLALCLLFAGQKSIGQTNFLDQPYLETSAKVDTLVTPDKIYMEIILLEKDTKGKVSIGELENRMQTVLKKLEIDIDKNLMLNDLASNFKKYLLKSQDVHLMKTYTLVVNSASSAGKVIRDLEGIGISNIDITKTEYTEIEQLKLLLKKQAILKAKKQATEMATALNQTIGPAIHVSDYNINSYNMDNRLSKASGLRIRGNAAILRSEAVFDDVEFEEIEISSAVEVKFLLNPVD